MCVATLGLIIGSPTLRVSGDYLAIVTLAFGEIFRIAVNNMDGGNGPDLTHGPNGIQGIPDLNLFGFNFGRPTRSPASRPDRYANYYFLLLCWLRWSSPVFVRLNNSRIGRGWWPSARTRSRRAMGVNVFGLKPRLRRGAARRTSPAPSRPTRTLRCPPTSTSSSSRPSCWPRSCSAAWEPWPGSRGTTLLKLMPEKLRFVSDYRLLMFGMLLVLMMRFRPEGLLPSSGDNWSSTVTTRNSPTRSKNCTSRPRRPRHRAWDLETNGPRHVVGEVVLGPTDVTMRSGGLTAVNKRVDDRSQGEIVGLIGPNGAGKTTFFNCLTGMYIPTEAK